MSTDDNYSKVDERLQADAANWRRDSAELYADQSAGARDVGDAPGAITLTSARQTRPHYIALLSAACIAALIAVGGFVILRNTSTTTSEFGSTSTSVSIDAECSQLALQSASITTTGGAGEYPEVTVTLANNSDRACIVSAYGPSVNVIDRSGASAGSAKDTSLVRYTHPMLEVVPSAGVEYRFTWASACLAGATGPYAFVVDVDGAVRSPGTQTITTRPLVQDAPSCAPGARGQIAMMFAKVKILPKVGK